MSPLEDIPGSAAPTRATGRRHGGRRAWLVLGSLTALLALAAGLLQVPAVARALFVAGLRQALADPATHVSVARVGGGLFRRLEADELRIEHAGHYALEVRTLRTRHALPALLAGRIELERLELRGVRLRTTADTAAAGNASAADWLSGRAWKGPALHVGELDCADLSVQAESESSGVQIDSARVAAHDLVLARGRAEVVVDTLVLHSRSRLTAERWCRAEFAGALGRGHLSVRTLRVRGGGTVLDAAGALVFGAEPAEPVREARFTLRAHPLALEDVGALLGAPTARGSIDAEAELAGTRPADWSGRVEARSNALEWPGAGTGEARLAAEITSGRVQSHAEGRWRDVRFELTADAEPFAASPAGTFEARLPELPHSVPGAPWWGAAEPRALEVNAKLGAGRLAYTARMSTRQDALTSRGELDLRTPARWVARGVALEHVPAAGARVSAGAAHADSLVWLRTHAGELRLHGVAIRQAELARWSANPSANATLNAIVDGTIGLDAPARGTLRVRLSPSTWAGRPAGPGEVRLQWLADAFSARGELAALAGRVGGEVRMGLGEAGGPVTIPELRFERLDLSSGLLAGARTELTGRLTGTFRPGAGDRAEGRMQLALERSQWNGRSVGPARIEGRLHAGELTFDVRAAAGDDELRAQAHATVRDTPWVWSGSAELPLALAASVLAPGLPASGRAHVELEGRGLTLATLTARARITATGAVRGLGVDSAQLVLRATKGVLFADTLDVRTAAGWLSSSGRVAALDSTLAPGPELSLRGAVTRGRPLAPLLGLDSLRVRGLEFAGRLRAASQAPRLELTARWDDVRAAGVRARGGQLTYEGALREPGRGSGDRLRVRLDRLQSSLLDARELLLAADGRDGLARFTAQARLAGTQPARLAGQWQAGQVRLDTLGIASARAPWSLARGARFTFARARLAVEDFELRSDSGRVVLAGVVDREHDSDLRAELRAVPLEPWTAWAGRPELGGRLDATLRLSGPGARAQLTGEALALLRAPWGAVGRLRGDVRWTDERLAVSGAFEPRGAAPLTVEASLPLALSLSPERPLLQETGGSVDVKLRGRAIPLVALGPLFDPHDFTPRGGVLDADAQWSGKPGALSGSGHIDVRDGDVIMPRLGARYRGVAIETRLDRTGLRVVSAQAASGKGSVRLSGLVRLPRFDRPELELELVAQDFKVMDSRDLSAMASGRLHLAGALAAPEVTGELLLRDTNVFLTPANGDTAEVELTPRDWRMLEDTFGAVDDAVPDAAQRLYAATRFGVQVKLAGDCWVRQRSVPRLEVELRGAFRFDKAPGGQPLLHGSVAPAPERGFVEQFARRFTFAGGDIQLNGPLAEHQLDIKTEYKASSSLASSAPRVVVHLDVQGTLDHLRLLLSSEPAMEQSEIVSYIIHGQTQRERTSSGAGASRTMAAAIPLQLGIAQLAGPIEELARQKVGLDVVEVRQDGLQGATVVAGRFLDPRLYVGFRQPLAAPARASRGPAKDGSRTRFELEYSAFEWLVLNLQGETSRLRSFVRVSRAY